MSLRFEAGRSQSVCKTEQGLEDRGFVPSSVDPCVFFGQGCIVLTYVDNCIIVGDSMQQIDALIESLHREDEYFVLQDKGSIDKYLGVNIKQIDANTFKLAQSFLIERITAFLGIKKGNTNEKFNPVGKSLLNKDLQGVPRKYHWEYCRAIGMLMYLTGIVQPDIAMATHQCARFSISPMRLHELAVMRIGGYLLLAKEKGMIYRPDSKTTLLVDGTQKMLKMLIVSTLKQDLLFAIPGVQCSGRANYKQRLLFQLLRQNILLYLKL